MHDTSAPAWFKSSYSGSSASDCVEAAKLDTGMLVRDSKDPEGPQLAFSAEAWTAFATDVAEGRLGQL
jgi:hypothetical protein